MGYVFCMQDTVLETTRQLLNGKELPFQETNENMPQPQCTRRQEHTSRRATERTKENRGARMEPFLGVQPRVDHSASIHH